MEHHYPATFRSTFGRLARIDNETQNDDEGVHDLPLHLFACCSLRLGCARHNCGLLATNLHILCASRARLEEARLLSRSYDMCVEKRRKLIPFCDWELLCAWGDIYEQCAVFLQVYIKWERSGAGQSWATPSNASPITPRYSARIE